MRIDISRKNETTHFKAQVSKTATSITTKTKLFFDEQQKN